jgi:hypothetical protein
VKQSVALSRLAVSESATLLHMYRRGYPQIPAPGAGTGAGAGAGTKAATGAGSAASAGGKGLASSEGTTSDAAGDSPDENRPPSTGGAADAATPTPPPSVGAGSGTTTGTVLAPFNLSSSKSFIISSSSGGASSSTADMIPWVPAPAGSLYSALPDAWREEFWFGNKWHEKDLALLAAAAAGEGGGLRPKGSSFGSVVNTVMALKRAASMSKAESAERERERDREARAVVPPGWSLGTVPQLSSRAQLVLLLRRLYEDVHIGGFERMSPPPNAALADRYRRIAEYVPPSLRETFAFAKRRLEALAMRAGIEAKKNSGFRL